MTTQSSRAERLAGLKERVANGDPVTQLKNLYAALWADAEDEINEKNEEITRLRSALEEAKLALRPFAEEAKYYADKPDAYRCHPTMRAHEIRLAAEVAAKLEKL